MLTVHPGIFICPGVCMEECLHKRSVYVGEIPRAVGGAAFICTCARSSQ